jgi:glycosyltransferase involved in cell wall biosynthesis
MKKKIVFITLAVGTYNTAFFNALNEKIKSWAEIYIIHYEGYAKHIPKNISKDIKLIGLEGINRFNNKLIKKMVKSEDSVIHYFYKYKNLNQTLKEIKPDLIQTFLYFMPYSLQASSYCKKHKIPLLSYEESQREPYFMLTRILNRTGLFFLRKTMIRNIKYIISPTKQGADFQGRFLANKNKVVHIPWNVDEKKFISLKRAAKQNKSLRLLAIARMVPYKKYDTIIAASAKLKEKKIPFKLTIIGSGPLENEIKKEIKNKKLEKDIEIIPRVEFENIKNYYLKSDIVILASVYESYGMIVPEAMACGCAVIVSDTAGVKFMVDEGKNGYTFKTGNSDDLAEKIEMSKNRTESFGEHSRKLMKTKFSTEQIINDYVKLLKKAGI